jgi:hypothetical protein
MPTIVRFEEIEAWQGARELTRLVYSLTEERRFARDFGLKDQIRRAAVSVMSNIAEGFESQTQAQFIRYLSLAKARSCWRKEHPAKFHASFPTSKVIPNQNASAKK